VVIFIDSSIYIGWLRQKRSPARLLEGRVRGGEVITCGLVRAEVLRGVIAPAAKNDLSGFFDLMPEIPTTSAVWHQTAELAWQLDRKGFILPLSDLIIAACALSVEAVLITADGHFSKIPELKIRKEL
jgi:predicted nucleic acid-binding protein